MTVEEQIEYEVYADGVDMKERILSEPNEDWRYFEKISVIPKGTRK